MEQAYYTIKEAAERLRCTTAAIRKWIAEGRMAVVYVGSDRRIVSAELDAFVERSTAERIAARNVDAPAVYNTDTTEPPMPALV